MKKMLAVALIVLVGVFMLSAPTVFAQGETGDCNGNFDCDEDVDGEDLTKFLSHFGRGTYDRPCPLCQDSLCPCTICPYGMVDCGDKCVDPQIEEDYCGVNSECVGGTVCGAGEICSAGVCDLNCPPGLTNCAGNCVDTDTNIDHCGSCPNVCFINEICVAGVCEASYPASVPKTGQITSDATGDDGDLQKGIEWPSPRFTDNSDGTVTDNLTGLIWLKNANCFGQNTWIPALSDCNTLSAGFCGLTDGSSAGDWRLPNISELLTLVDRSQYDPVLPPGHPFTAVQLADYWSSTAVAYSNDAWSIMLDHGDIFSANKTFNRFIWPIRDPL